MDLKVQLPIRFRKQLEQRWNPENAELFKFPSRFRELGLGLTVFATNQSNPLCSEYRYFKGCPRCPFNKFAINSTSPCLRWIELVLGKPPEYFRVFEAGIYYTEGTEGLAELKEFIEKAKKLIEWVN